MLEYHNFKFGDDESYFLYGHLRYDELVKPRPALLEGEEARMCVVGKILLNVFIFERIFI